MPLKDPQLFSSERDANAWYSSLILFYKRKVEDALMAAWLIVLGVIVLAIAYVFYNY